MKPPVVKPSLEETCRQVTAEREAFFKEAFTNPVTKEPYPVPADIKEAATNIVLAYGIRGICDPMYIANTIALSTGRGDGKGNFNHVKTS